MELKQQEAVAARQAYDNAERHRQAALMRQVRNSELERSAAVPTGGAPTNGENRAAQPPANLPKGPSVISPPPSNSGTMLGQNGAYPPSNIRGGFPAAPNPANPGPNSSQTWNVPNPQGTASTGFLRSDRNPQRHAERDTNNPEHEWRSRVNGVSPLDAMPTWPPQESVPGINPAAINQSGAYPPNGASSFAQMSVGQTALRGT